MYYLKSFMSNDCHVIGRLVSADKSPSTFSGLHMLSMNNNSDERCIPKRLERSYSVLFLIYIYIWQKYTFGPYIMGVFST